MSILYYEHDLDRMICTQYEREGECRQCGECCKKVIHLTALKPFHGDECRNGGDGVGCGGLWSAVVENGVTRAWRVGPIEAGKPCYYLTAEGHCGMHEAPERTAICRLWPMSPSNITAFPNCGYSFRPIGRWRIVRTSDGGYDYEDMDAE